MKKHDENKLMLSHHKISLIVLHVTLSQTTGRTQPVSFADDMRIPTANVFIQSWPTSLSCPGEL